MGVCDVPGMVAAARVVRVNWNKRFRITRSIYRPISLFEESMDPADWELVVAANAKLDSKFSSVLGNLSNVPIGRRVAGPGASVVMAPFVHCSPNNPSRFSDGSYGIYYAGNSEQLALAETIHHHACFMLDDEAAPCWISGFQLVEGSVDSELHDVDAVPGARDPDDYRLSQQIGKALRNAGSEGLTWTSARLPGGKCIGVFWPDVVSIPRPVANYSYHWDGARVDLVENLDSGEIVRC